MKRTGDTAIPAIKQSYEEIGMIRKHAAILTRMHHKFAR